MRENGLNIKNFLRRHESYSQTRVREVAESGDLRIYLIDGRDDKPKQSVHSEADMAQDACPYCQEAVCSAHLGDVAEWSITSNKYPGTDKEVLAVSQEHSPHLRGTDFRVWMHMAAATDSVLTYSPSRKSVPAHKHAPLFDFKESPLLSTNIEWVEDGIGLTSGYKHVAVAITGDFEKRYEKTMQILKKVYAREHLYVITVTPDATYILPSKVNGRTVDNRVFIGISVTDNREHFEYMKKPPEERDGFVRIPDYSDSSYDREQLLDLIKEEPCLLPDTNAINATLAKSHSSVSAVYAIGEDVVIPAYAVAKECNVEFQCSGFAFVTDKKGHFFPDSIPAVFKNLESTDRLLIVVRDLTKNIAEYLVALKAHFGVSSIHVLYKKVAAYELLGDFGENEDIHSESKQEEPIRAEQLPASENIRLYEHIRDLRSDCIRDGMYVEMLIGLNVTNFSDFDVLKKEFGAATTKIVSLKSASTSEEIRNDIESNVVPYMRAFSPATKSILSYLTENDDIGQRTDPTYQSEEGVIVCYIDDVNITSDEYEQYMYALERVTKKKVRLIGFDLAKHLLQHGAK